MLTVERSEFVRPGENCRRAGDANVTVKTFHSGREFRKLIRCRRIAALVRAGKVRHQSNRANRVASCETIKQLRRLRERETQPVHPGIELQPNGNVCGRGCFQYLDLRLAMNHQLAIVCHRYLEILCGKHTGEQYDGLLYTGIA